ncbi:MAG TPA: hypothetical protein VKP66_20460 [Steroidobacteraceae bacterium]|nr:hypothetical protein [Steroidobacteraceae bacterium]
MKSALRIAAAALITIGAMTLACNRVLAQAMAGRQLGTNRVSVDYYKAPPGRQDEWLALYKKYHRPIMDFQISKGVTISSTLYAAKSHAPGMPWDFVIINVSPPEGEGPKLGMTRAEVIRKLFPDIEDYVKGERQRWALTVNHWDEDLVELDITRDPLSVYYPLDALPKKK